MTNNNIDEVNNAFLDIVSKDTRMTQAVIDGMTPEEAVEKYQSTNERDAEFYYLLAILTIVLTKQSLTHAEQMNYAPIIAITTMYSIKAPRLFADKVNKLFKGVNLTKREKSARKIIRGFIDKGKATVRKIQQNVIKSRIKTHSEIYKDIKDEKLTKKELKNKYDKKRLRRAKRTEAHAELEQGKLQHAEEFGYKFKTWKTRGDGRVRDTTWHNAVKNKKIPVNNMFRASGMKAMYPGDITLPIGERINCRCYLLLE